MCRVNISITQHNLHQLVQLYVSVSQVHVCLAHTRFSPDHVAITSMIESRPYQIQNMSHGMHL